jgi:hypothetical protein
MMGNKRVDKILNPGTKSWQNIIEAIKFKDTGMQVMQ